MEGPKHRLEGGLVCCWRGLTPQGGDIASHQAFVYCLWEEQTDGCQTHQSCAHLAIERVQLVKIEAGYYQDSQCEQHPTTS